MSINITIPLRPSRTLHYTYKKKMPQFRFNSLKLENKPKEESIINKYIRNRQLL